ncbi:MAG: ribonuclease P [Nanoarchaeota archaeon]
MPLYKKKPASEQASALKKIENYFQQAAAVHKADPGLADEYVQLAWKQVTKHKVRLRPELKKQLCRHCFSYLVPGSNCRVRLQDKKLVYYCLKCRHFMRFPYKKEGKYSP